MSGEKRQHARTQGRFNKDSAGLTNSDSARRSRGRGSFKNNQRQSNLPSPADGVLLSDYMSAHHFPELETVKEPTELRFNAPTIHILSETVNGQSRIFFDPKFIDSHEADDLFVKLLHNLDWNEEDVIINGKSVPQPRLVIWFGPLPYTYSGLTLDPQEFPDEILKIKRSIEYALKSQGINVELNSVLLNLYRNEKDSVAWHSDDEISMGICPTIASLSLGTSRRFQLRHKTEDKFAAADYVIHLDHGSLIVMDGVMQMDWQHRVPKEFHSRGERINLTFRTVYAIDRVDSPLSQPADVKAKLLHRRQEMKSFTFEDDGFPTLNPSSNTEPKPQRKSISTKKHSNSKKNSVLSQNKNIVLKDIVKDHVPKTENTNDTETKITSQVECSVCEEFDTNSNKSKPSSILRNKSAKPVNPNNDELKSAQDSPERNHEVIDKSEKISTIAAGEGSNVSKITEGFTSFSTIEFDDNYKAECTRLQQIYGHIKQNEDTIPFTIRDKEELDVLFTVIDHSGVPLRLKVLTKVCDRMIKISQYAEQKHFRQGQNRNSYSNRYQHSGRYNNRTFHNQYYFE